MSAAQLTDRRTIRAQSIIQAGDIHESKPGLYRVRDQAGSGRWHFVTANSCSCEDFRRNGLDCKHRLALANWSTRQAPADELPGNFLDGDFSAFDDVQLTAPRSTWYKGFSYTAEQLAAAAQARATMCPDCQGATKEDLLWCGKAAWVRFRVCQANREHRATRI